MKKRIFIVGSRGFIGSNFSHLSQESKEYEYFESHKYNFDITEKENIKKILEEIKPDALINFGSIASLDPKDERNIYSVNSFGVKNLLDSLKAIKFKGIFLQASSAYVYKNSDDILEENSDLFPSTHYGCSKLLAEKYCYWYKNSFHIFIFRMFNIIGVGQKSHFLIPKLISEFSNKSNRIELGNINIYRDYMDVRDLSNLLLKIVNKYFNNLIDDNFNIVNICSGESYEIGEVIIRLKKLTNHNPEIITNNYSSISSMNSNVNQFGSNTRLNSMIKYEKLYNIEDTFDWMLKSINYD